MVNISNDKMSASIYLPFEDKEKFQVDELKQMLAEAGVVYGIDEQALQEIAAKDVVVAAGTRAQDGNDAYYKYYFDVYSQKSSPRILEDGRVDYTNHIEIVKQDAVVAKYIEPEEGIDGTDVCGNPIKGKKGKKLSLIRGKGFYRDGNEYKASFDGKIEMAYDVITISKVMDIDGDVNKLSGDIDFLGDVLIHGAVCAGMTVKSGGNITVNGYVEAAYLYAEGDIIINSGINGANIAKIEAKGDVKGNFFEGVNIRAKGDVTTNSILNSYIEAEGRIYVEGKRGLILGGITNAVSGIEVRNAGNNFNTETTLYAGVYPKTIEECKQYMRLHDETRKILAGLTEFLEKVDKLPPEKITDGIRKKKTDVMRACITKKAQLKGIDKKLEEIRSIIENGSHATIRIDNIVYPGVKVQIGNCKKTIDQIYKEVQIREFQNEIIIESI